MNSIADQVNHLLEDWISQYNIAAILLEDQKLKLTYERWNSSIQSSSRWSIYKDDAADSTDRLAILQITKVDKIPYIFCVTRRDYVPKDRYLQYEERSIQFTGVELAYMLNEPNDILEFLELLRSKLLQFQCL